MKVKSKDAEPMEKIEVKLLRSESGQVIFLESGPDFAELMYGIMNTPLSSLLPSSAKDDCPFLDLKESLQNLGSQSFAVGKDGGSFIPKTSNMKELMLWTQKAKQKHPVEEHQMVPFGGKEGAQTRTTRTMSRKG